MAQEIDLQPITHITTDAIGPPGKRVFYIQAYQKTRTITLVIEKFQIQQLAVGIEQFLAEIQEKFPNLPEASPSYKEDNMRIHPPIDPLFRVGELALGYDTENDLIILVTQEIVPEGEDPDDFRAIRFWCNRSQMRAFAHWAIEVASRGRPLCPQCGAPMDLEEKHFCPKKNGHRG
ncbi:MAG: DUF3090 domain-containing protein [Anaerolineales bacterium]